MRNPAPCLWPTRPLGGPKLVALPVLIGVLAITGCGDVGKSGGDEAAAASNEYVVERSFENGIEAMRTVSGSRWGGNATLVEELSIGEEIGPEAYLFGSVTGAWATDDRIYLIDAQVPAVRAFDLHGRHLFDLGGPGQGPGEYGRPAAIAVTDDGRVMIADSTGARIIIYDGEGALIEDRPLRAPKSALGLVLSYDGEIYTQSWSLADERMGIQAVGPDGLTGEILFPPLIAYEPPTVSVGKGLAIPLPFAPAYSWVFAPGGEMVAGVGSEYRFEIHRPDGAALRVERSWAPVPVEAEEAAFRARIASNAMRMMSPGLGMSSADVLPNKPAFSGFYADRAGRVWVLRQGPGRPDPACIDAASPPLLMATPAGTSVEIAGKFSSLAGDADEDECWADTFTFDLFDIVTGDFLGAIDAPDYGFRVPLFADNDTVLAAVMDEAGTVRLKQYRLQIEKPE